MLLAAPVTHLPWQGMAPLSDNARMTVRLAPAPARAPDFPVSPPPEARRPQLPVPPPAGDSGGLPGSRPTPSTAEARAKAPTLPEPPDPNYYPARDLDDYPRPLAPLRIDQPLGSSAGEVRLELLIDEHVVVRDITFSGIAESGGTHEALRGALIATLFIPAIKNGRAVRSRIVLSVGFPTASER